MDTEKLDIVLGSRMGADSKMPGIRRFGNTLFVNLIKILSKSQLTDSASGMRIIKRSSLKRIYPLPDGLHFTPAMSAKALFDKRIDIGEIEMTYEEREGRSKLHVVKDGVRFLRIIISTALAYNPLRVLGLLGLVSVLISTYYITYPIVFYVQNRFLEEWMFYRITASFTGFFAAFQMISVGHITQRLIDITNGFPASSSVIRDIIDYTVVQNGFIFSLGCFVAATFVVWDALISYVTLGEVHEHWSRIITGSFLLLLGSSFFVSGFLRLGLGFLTEQDSYNKSNRLVK
jgi:hypothetical protein